MTNLLDEVVPVERWLRCPHCRVNPVKPVLSKSGPHIRADCSQCGRYIKFVKQISEHPESEEPELYKENLPW